MMPFFFKYESNSLLRNVIGGVYLGDIGTGLFFILSGVLLEYLYSDIVLDWHSLRLFYVKRIKSIYPLYWSAYFCVTLVLLPFRDFNVHSLQYFPLSVLGLDGFLATVGFSQAGMYYKVGEWFLGCIVCVYVVYPFFAAFFHKYPWLCTILTLTVYGCFIHRLSPAWFFFQFPYFLLGMSWSRWWGSAKNKQLWITTAAAVILRIALNDSLASWTKAIVLNWTLFLTIILICELFPIQNEKVLRKLKYLSFLTYPIFLVHHQIISNICRHLNLAVWSYWKTLILFLIYSILCILAAKIIVCIKDLALGAWGKIRAGNS